MNNVLGNLQGLSPETDISDPDPAIHNAGKDLLKKSMQVSKQAYSQRHKNRKWYAQ